MRKRVAALLCILLAGSLLQGCWNYRELDSIMIVAGFAVDRGMEGGQYHLTIDLIGTASAGKDKPVETIIVDTEGDTIFDAVRNVVERTGNKLYWPHCQIAVISEEVARDGIGPVIDWLMRDAEPRLTLEILISQEKTAREILMLKPISITVTSFEIDKTLENNVKFVGTAQSQLLYTVTNTLESKGTALTLPVVHSAKNGEGTTAELYGTAVFEGDRLVGYLSPEETKYFLFVTNGIQGGVLNVTAPTGNPIAALEIYSNRTKLEPSVANGNPSFSVNTTTTVSIDEIDGGQNYFEKDVRGGFTAMAEEQLQQMIAQTVQSVQSRLGIDIFGFGEALHVSDPMAWGRYSENWNEIFKTVNVEIKSKINIKNDASITGIIKEER